MKNTYAVFRVATYINGRYRYNNRVKYWWFPFCWFSFGPKYSNINDSEEALNNFLWRKSTPDKLERIVQ